jgi:PAP2 superfamily
MLRFCWCWTAGIAGLVLISCVCGTTVIAVDSSLVTLVGLISICLMGAHWCRRQKGAATLEPLFLCLALLLATSVSFAFLQYPVARLDRPLIDNQLAMFDSWLRFDWSSCFAWVIDHPPVCAALRAVYLSLEIQSVLMCIVALRDPRRIAVCLVANILTLTCCTAIYAAWPAAGAFAFFHPPGITSDYVDQFLGVRSGAISVLALGQMKGIIQYPSYHAAAAVMLAYAFWSMPRWIAFCAAAVEIILCASAVPIGGHHLVDIIAGIWLAATMLAIVNIAVRPQEHSTNCANSVSTTSLLTSPKRSSILTRFLSLTQEALGKSTTTKATMARLGELSRDEVS